MNSYWGTNFFTFFSELFHRFLLMIQGRVPFSELASDEIQILVLVLISISSALIGTFLVLRNMTMLANSLSHTILLGIIIAFLIFRSRLDEGVFQMISTGEMLIASFIAGLLTTLFTEGMTKVLKLQEDASIGLVFTSLFALGIICASLFTRNAHIGIDVIMGNIDALHINDLKLTFQIALVNILITCFFFKQYQITTFDPLLAKNLGISTIAINYLLMVQTSASAIGAFRAVGVVLFLAFLVCPVLIARLIKNRLEVLLLLACAIGVFASVIAVALSRHILSVYQVPLSTSGLVVMTLVCIYALMIGVKFMNCRKAHA